MGAGAGGRALAVGGLNSNGYLASAEIFDPGTGTWSPAGSMATSRYDLTAVRLPSGKVLVTGGFGDALEPNFQQSTEMYDPDTNSWSRAASTSVARIHAPGYLLPDGTVIVIVGDPYTADSKTTEIYNPATDAWTAGPLLLVGRTRPATAQLPDGRVVVAGGSISGWPFRTAEAEILGPTPPGVPGAPTSVQATAGDSSATVTWSPPGSNGGSPITSYRLESSNDDVVTVPAEQTGAVVTGLINGQTYTFKVRAINALGWSPLSEPSNSVVPRAASTTSAASQAPPGGTVATNTAVSSSDPVGTSVTTPTGGMVSITETQATQPSTSGYSFLGQQIDITAPDASTESPLRLLFTLDASILPEGADASTLTVFRNGEAMGDCTGTPGTASPDPCVADRQTIDEGDVRLTVLTSHASRWNFGLHSTYPFQGLFWPVSNPALTYKAGAAVPVRFGLGGNQGPNVLASGHPRSRPCGTTGPGEATSGKLKYDIVKDRYVYTWSTAKSWSSAAGGGPCREFILRLNDGTLRSQEVRFR